VNWYSEVLVKLPLFNSTDRVSLLDYLEPTTRTAIAALIVDALAQNIKLMVFETYRSQHRQELLFDQGATQLKEVGVHGYGLACDIVKDIGGDPSWKGDFTFMTSLAKKHGLISGIDWGNPNIKHGFVDSCHVQRIAVRDQLKLFDGSWFPDNSYNPYKLVSV
jgi:D-alanyl-D-alanine carboxypeptidase